MEFTTRKDDQGITEYVLRWKLGAGPEDELVVHAPIELEVVVEARVRRVPGTPHYSYGYWVSNAKTSRQGLYKFIVEAAGSLTGVGFPDEGWRNPTQHAGEWARLGTMEAIAWSDSFGFPSARVAPGTTAGPFGFQSPLPPGIVRTFVRGAVPIISSKNKGEIPPDADVAHGIHRSALFGKTVGPVRFPASPLEHLATLLVVADEAVTLGWISPASGGGVTVLLGKAQTCLRGSDEEGMHRALASLHGRLDAMKGEGLLLEEAYSILRFNIEHLDPSVAQP